MRHFVKNEPAIWVFASALVLLILTVAVADKITASYRTSTASITLTREVEVHIARARAALAQAQTAFLTESASQETSVQTYRDCLREAEAEVAQIRPLTVEDPRQQQSLNALTQELANLRRNILDALLTPDPPPAGLFQNAEEELKKMRVEEASLLAARVQLSEGEYRRMLIFIRASFALAAIILLWSSLDILRQSAKAARAEKVVRALNLQLQNAQDDEAKKLGRELHDSVGQLLAAAKMALSGIAVRPDIPENTKQQLQITSEATDEAMREVRTISYLLHPPLLDELGFSVAAKWYVMGFSERSGIAVNLDLPQEDAKLPPEVSLALFRALQVGLGNVHRHSQSKSADVSLTRRANRVVLEIRDAGVGIPADRLQLLQSLPAAAGVGLGGLKERLSQFSGALEIDSDSSGTVLRVLLPTTTHTATPANQRRG